VAFLSLKSILRKLSQEQVPVTMKTSLKCPKDSHTIQNSASDLLYRRLLI